MYTLIVGMLFIVASTVWFCKSRNTKKEQQERRYVLISKKYYKGVEL